MNFFNYFSKLLSLRQVLLGGQSLGLILLIFSTHLSLAFPVYRVMTPIGNVAAACGREGEPVCNRYIMPRAGIGKSAKLSNLSVRFNDYGLEYLPEKKDKTTLDYRNSKYGMSVGTDFDQQIGWLDTHHNRCIWMMEIPANNRLLANKTLELYGPDDSAGTHYIIGVSRQYLNQKAGKNLKNKKAMDALIHIGQLISRTQGDWRAVRCNL